MAYQSLILRNRVCASLVLSGLVAGLAPMAAHSAPQDPVSSDGQGLEVLYTEMSVSQRASKPFSGAAQVSAEALYIEGAEVYDSLGGRLSPREFRRLSALPDPGAGNLHIETILGADTRERMYTTNYPARAKALITFSSGRCSGNFISKDTVATAGHCVHTGGSGGFYPVTSFRVYPGADGSKTPYGYCTAKRLYTIAGWANGGNEEYDYGAIKLNCTVGNTVGWFGFSSASPGNLPSIIQGYPGDKPLEQWSSSDKVRAVSTRQIFYANDTMGGMSGSGVWYDNKGPMIIGIHAYGAHGSGDHGKYNHGTRITTEVFNNLKAWKDAS